MRSIYPLFVIENIKKKSTAGLILFLLFVQGELVAICVGLDLGRGEAFSSFF
jgi:hypothetical protein